MTRYVASGGVHIAYQVLGAGERDIVFVPGAMSHLDLLWEDPETATFFRRLSTLGRLILFDKRDTGLSDRAPADSPLEERMDDAAAVMGAASASQAVLFGYSEGAPMSILFAAAHPERVTALILGAATARYPWAPDYPCGAGSDEMFEALTEIAAHRWGQGESIEWFLPSRAGSPEARRLFARFERMAVSPSAFLRIVRMIRQIDVRAVLPAIHVPTLVIQRRDDRMTPPCHGRYLASHIAGARYFEQPGDHALRFAGSGDGDALIDEIEDFLTSAPGPQGPDRALATILLAEAAACRPPIPRPPIECAPTGAASSRAPQPASSPPSPPPGRPFAARPPSATMLPHEECRYARASTSVKWISSAPTSPACPSGSPGASPRSRSRPRSSSRGPSRTWSSGPASLSPTAACTSSAGCLIDGSCSPSPHPADRSCDLSVDGRRSDCGPVGGHPGRREVDQRPLWRQPRLSVADLTDGQPHRDLERRADLLEVVRVGDDIRPADPLTSAIGPPDAKRR